MPYFKKNEGFSLGFTPYTRGDASPFKSTPASRIKDAKRNAKFDYQNAIAGTRDPAIRKQARIDYRARMKKIREREKDLRVPKKFKSPFKSPMSMHARFKSPSMTSWEIDANMRRKKKDDEQWAKWKKKKEERKAKRKAKKNSPFSRKTYMGKPIKRTLNPFDRHHKVKNDLGYWEKKKILKGVKNQSGGLVASGGAGGGPKDMEMWAKRNRG